MAGQNTTTYSPLKVWAFSGQTGGLLYYVSNSTSYLDHYGNALDGIGDITNDGFDDFVVGAEGSNSNDGNLFIYSGKDGSLVYEANGHYSPREKLGCAVAGVGDTDSDGSPDFVVGAFWGDDPDNPSQNS